MQLGSVRAGRILSGVAHRLTITNGTQYRRPLPVPCNYSATVVPRRQLTVSNETPRAHPVPVPVARTFSTMSHTGIKFLSQAEAIQIDQDLFNEYQFSVDQLMELAGLACAQSVATVYEDRKKFGRVLVACGPGNNGGDGFVCARHLKLFGYTPTVLYPKPSKSDLMQRLVRQIEGMEIPMMDTPSEGFGLNLLDDYDMVVDALFGFSLKPPTRDPFTDLLNLLANMSKPLISIDIPSGWHVETGPPSDGSAILRPSLLVSLTAPKKCAEKFTGAHHYLGGRFVPKSLTEKYDLNLPDYPGLSGILKL